MDWYLTLGLSGRSKMIPLSSICINVLICSLVPRPSITANAVEVLVKLLRRMTSGGHLEAWLTCHACTSTAVHWKCHASRRPPDIILRRSVTRPSTVLAVIEGLGTRLLICTFWTSTSVGVDSQALPSFGMQNLGDDLSDQFLNVMS